MTIHKLCAACSRYFTGEMNGEYLCPECRQSTGMKHRPLSEIDAVAFGCRPLPPTPAAKGKAA